MCTSELFQSDPLAHSQEQPRQETSVSGMVDPSVIYQIVLLLHIAAAIVGFGGIIAHSTYNARAFGGNAGDARVLLNTTQTVTNLAHNAIYGVFLLGIALVALSDGGIGFGEAWISASFVVWFAMVGLAHGMVKPAVRSLKEKAEGMNGATKMSDDPEVISLAKKLALGDGLTQLLIVAAIALMIWQPGAPS